MSGDTVFVFALISVAAVMMASNRIRFDVIALLVVLSLILSGILSVGEALSGFGSSVVIMVAGLLVVGEMLDRTGVARAVGDMILKKGGSNEMRLLVVIMISAALLGSVMSSTAIVAIFIPIVLRIAAETNLNASRLLLPMSYAALISGMLTLIASPPNLVVSEELRAAGFGGFGFFSFSIVGLVILVVAVLYFVFLGRHLLPGASTPVSSRPRRRSVFELWEDFRGERQNWSAKITPNSPLIGSTIAASELESRYGVHVLGIMRKTGGEQRIVSKIPTTPLQAGDILPLIGLPDDYQRLITDHALMPHTPSQRDQQRWLWELGAAAVLIHPESGLIGKSLREIEFRTRYSLDVLGLRRNGQAVGDYRDTKLAASDSLLSVGAWKYIQQLQAQHHDFVVLEMPAEHTEVVPAYRRMPAALVILITMVLLSIFDVMPLVAAVIIAGLAAGATRCLTMEDAYRSIHWSSLVLVAGMLPLADALQKTGGTEIIVDALIHGIGDTGPRLMFTVLFFLTAGLGLVLSNTASAVLVAPIAIAAADALGVSPYSFAIAVLIAASAAYSTPVSTPVVTLVVEPGRYKFMDFVKLGVPLLLLTYLATLLVAPLVFPFTAP